MSRQQQIDTDAMHAGPFLKDNQIVVPSYVYFPAFTPKWNTLLKKMHFTWNASDQQWSHPVSPEFAQIKLIQVRALYFKAWGFKNPDEK
jgi:hypothetical protein